MRRSASKASRIVRLVSGVMFFSLFHSFAFSQAPFYQGKTVTVIQATEAGGSSDVMTRAVLPYLKKHIPGQPTVVSEYMPGGGGTKAANHVFKNVRPDGLTIGRIGGGLVANAVLGEKGESMVQCQRRSRLTRRVQVRVKNGALSS